jgi:MinD-like ATPase involved in chromosome partitioning or flagellar assembly
MPGPGGAGTPAAMPAMEPPEPAFPDWSPSPATSQPPEDRNFITSQLDPALFSAAIEGMAGAPGSFAPPEESATGGPNPASPPEPGHPGLQYGGGLQETPPGAPASWPSAGGAPYEAPPAPAPTPGAGEPPGSNDLVRRNVHGDPLLRRVGMGVRKAVGGTGAHDVRQQAEMIDRIRQPMPSCRQIAVTSIRGGAGKTTVSALVARTIADFRGDRVLAVDADPGLGSLPLRLGARTDRSLRELAQVRLNSLEDAGPYLGRSAERLWVLPATTAGSLSDELDLDVFRAAMANLTRYFAAAVVDCGAGIGDLQRGILTGVHGQVLVAQGTADGAYSTQRTLEWMVASGYGALLGRTVIALVTHSPHVDSDLDRARQMLSTTGMPVVHVPYDRQLATGATIDMTRISSGSRTAAVRIAAEVLGRAATI